MGWWILWFILVFLALLIVYSLGSITLHRLLFSGHYFPTRDRGNHFQDNDYHVYTADQEARLHLRRIPSSNKDPKYTILFFHGNQGNVEDWTTHIHRRTPLVSLGDVWLFDYRGYGLSTGTPTLEGICNDGYSVFQFVHRYAHALETNLVIYGFSLGGFVASYVTTLHPHDFSHCILQAPLIHLDHIVQHVTGWGIPRSFLPDMDVETWLRQLPQSDRVYVLGSEEDEIIPPHSLHSLESFLTHVELGEYGGHNEMSNHPEFQSKLRDCLA